MSGLAGGRYGIGGSEPKARYFKNRMKKDTSVLRHIPVIQLQAH
jgi:hypothetical protein